jgi:hypothetical protein
MEGMMWELQWLFAAVLLAVASFLSVVVYVLYRIRADVEQIVRLQRSHNERFDEMESVLRYMDFRLSAEHSSSAQKPGPDAWSQALKALDALEDDAPQLVIDDAFSTGTRTSREQFAQRAPTESPRHERSG